MARTQVTTDNVLDESLTGIDISEDTLDSALIPFSSTGFASVNVSDGIIEAKEGNGKFIFKYVLDSDLIIKNNYSKVASRIKIGNNKLKLEGNAILELV